MKMEDLTKEQISELQEAFSLFDKNETGTISCIEFGSLIRSLGYNPSENKLNAIVEELSDYGTDTIDFTLFLRLICKHLKDTFNKNDIVDAFKVFDREGIGYINAGELRYILTTQGEKLSNDEVDELLREVKVDSEGRIKFDEFVNLITSDM